MPNAATASVWVVTASCGDYYCENDHIVAICDTEEAAQAAMQKVVEGELEGYVSWGASSAEKRTLNEAKGLYE